MNGNDRTLAGLRDLQSLSGRIALVTGGCRNFGAEIASGLAEAGAVVIVTARELERAVRGAAELSEAVGFDFIPMELELTDEKSVTALFAEVKERFGRLDILVNNAGGHSKKACGLLEKESLEGWHEFIEPNMTGTFLMIREFARLMMPQRSGSIINVASMAGMVGRDRKIYGDDMTPNPIAYSAAKAGVIGMTYDCAAYLGEYGIRVNAISPGGFARTQPEHFIKDYSQLTMLKRMGRAGYDLKGAVAFLASDAAAYITGHNLVIDGGFTRYK